MELKPLFALVKGLKQNCRETYHLFEGLHWEFLSIYRVKDEKNVYSDWHDFFTIRGEFLNVNQCHYKSTFSAQI